MSRPRNAVLRSEVRPFGSKQIGVIGKFWIHYIRAFASDLELQWIAVHYSNHILQSTLYSVKSVATIAPFTGSGLGLSKNQKARKAFQQSGFGRVNPR